MQNIVPFVRFCVLVRVIAASPESHKYAGVEWAEQKFWVAEVGVVHSHLLVHLDLCDVFVYFESCVCAKASSGPHDDTLRFLDEVHDFRNFSKILYLRLSYQLHLLTIFLLVLLALLRLWLPQKGFCVRKLAGETAIHWSEK